MKSFSLKQRHSDASSNETFQDVNEPLTVSFGDINKKSKMKVRFPLEHKLSSQSTLPSFDLQYKLEPQHLCASCVGDDGAKCQVCGLGIVTKETVPLDSPKLQKMLIYPHLPDTSPKTTTTSPSTEIVSDTKQASLTRFWTKIFLLGSLLGTLVGLLIVHLGRPGPWSRVDMVPCLLSGAIPIMGLWWLPLIGFVNHTDIGIKFPMYEYAATVLATAGLPCLWISFAVTSSITRLILYLSIAAAVVFCLHRRRHEKITAVFQFLQRGLFLVLVVTCYWLPYFCYVRQKVIGDAEAPWDAAGSLLLSLAFWLAMLVSIQITAELVRGFTVISAGQIRLEPSSTMFETLQVFQILYFVLSMIHYRSLLLLIRESPNIF